MRLIFYVFREGYTSFQKAMEIHEELSRVLGVQGLRCYIIILR